MVIDVGAAGNGYLVEVFSAMLYQTSVTESVNVGGCLRHCGRYGIRVRLKHPEEAQQVIEVFELREGAQPRKPLPSLGPHGATS